MMNFYSLKHYELFQNAHRDRVNSIKLCNLSITRKTNLITRYTIPINDQKLTKNNFFLFPFKSLFTNLSSSFSFQIIFRRSAEHFHSNDHKTLLFVSTRVKMKNKTDTGFIYTLRGKTKHFVRLFLSSRFDGNHGSTSV